MQNKTKKLISAILIISIIIPTILFSIPKKANAWWGVGDANITDLPALYWAKLQAWWNSSTSTSSKRTAIATTQSATLQKKTLLKEIYKEVKMAIAKRLLQEMTKSIVNWINSGFHGSPLFLENPQSFFKDVAKSEIKDIVDTFGYDNIRFPFGKDFVLNTINSYKSTLANNASYTLSTVMNDKAQLYNYQNNFNVGGWNGFLINTQYPQNNYLGFQMMATEELANRLQGTSQTAAQKVQTALQQGQGFLSPQKCDPAVNPNYNNGTNEFQKPSFKASKEYNPPHPYPADDIAGFTEQEKAENKEYDTVYKEGLALEKQNFNEKNTCLKKDGTSGLINTTPGSVVSNQIMSSLRSGQNQTELSMAMGNSLSAVFDALLNKFIGDGLSSLASKANPPPPEDNWSYDGQTLGVAGDSGSNWSTFPDEEISLNEFRKQISGKTIRTTPICKKDGISSTETSSETCSAVGGEWVIEEIGKTNNGKFVSGDIANMEEEKVFMELIPQLISNRDINNPGIIQSTEALDKCLPGPDKGWENRLNMEQQRFVAKFPDETSNSDLNKRATNAALKELQFAVTSFKDWITTEMMSSLPNSINYMDAVKNIDNFPQQLEELTKSKQDKSQTLVRLKAINKTLDSLVISLNNKEPEKGSVAEKTLISLRKQYNAIAASISSRITVEDTKAQLDTLNDKIKNLKEFNAQCLAERTTEGWSSIDPTGYGKSTKNGITEIEKFCGITLPDKTQRGPIFSGYSHGDIVRPYDWRIGRKGSEGVPDPSLFKFTFRNPNNNDDGDPGYTDLPMVNAKWVYGDLTCTGICSWADFGTLNLGSVTIDPFGPLNEKKNEPNDERISINLDCSTIFKTSSLDYLQPENSSL